MKSVKKYVIVILLSFERTGYPLYAKQSKILRQCAIPGKYNGFIISSNAYKMHYKIKIKNCQSMMINETKKLNFLLWNQNVKFPVIECSKHVGNT